MKRAIRNTLVTSAAFAGIAASGCSVFEKDTFDPSTTGAVEAAFNSNMAFWKKKVGEAATTQLIMLEGDETSACGGATITSTDEFASYCSGGNAIVIPAEAAQIMSDFGETEKVIAHEFGHAVQSSKPDLLDNAPSDPSGFTKYKELQATCLAGVFAGATMETTEVPLLYNSFLAGESSDAHGTGAEQAAAFNAGSNAGVENGSYLKACVTF